MKQAYKQTQDLMHRQHKTDLIFFLTFSVVNMPDFSSMKTHHMNVELSKDKH